MEESEDTDMTPEIYGVSGIEMLPTTAIEDIVGATTASMPARGESAVKSNPKLERNRWVWKHFKRVYRGKAVCLTCMQICYFAQGTTHSLLRHLKKEHNILEEDVTEMPAIKRRSELWNHFQLLEKDKFKAKCFHCDKIISISGGSRGNMTRHLRHKHPEITINGTQGEFRNCFYADISTDQNDPCPKPRMVRFKRALESGTKSKENPQFSAAGIKEEYESLQAERSPEELQVVIETNSGIIMNYRTLKRTVNFQLENKLLRNVKLLSRSESLCIQASDGKLSISLNEGGYSDNNTNNEQTPNGYAQTEEQDPLTETEADVQDDGEETETDTEETNNAQQFCYTTLE